MFGRQNVPIAASKGARLSLVARRAETLDAVVEECGGAAKAFAIVADVSRQEEVKGAVDSTIAHYGRLDVLINNVGRGISRPPSQLTDVDIDEMMTINVKSALYGMQAVLPHFGTTGRGHIINVSSTLGRMPVVLPRAAYSASKHFLNALTANFRDELRETHPGVAVSLVSPGLVYTDFGGNALHGGVDSRSLPDGQDVDGVAAVLMQAVETRHPDLYTTPGRKALVMEYLDGLSSDPSTVQQPPKQA